MNSYPTAKEQYAALGVDTDQALDTLRNVSLSIHCWQGDDVSGFEAPDSELSGGGIARTVFLDDLKIAVYAESFGAVHHMPAAQVDFIRNWEAEKYRSEVSAG